MLLSSITIYHALKTIAAYFFSTLKFREREHPKGRKPLLTNSEVVLCALLWRRQNIGSKKSLYEILEPALSYNRFIVALNRIAPYLAVIIIAILRFLKEEARLVKLTDATDIPACLPKNANTRKTMHGLAAWSKTGKGWFYGLKLHLSGDVEGRVLSLRLTPGNSSDRAVFRKMNETLRGLFVADAGYVSHELERDFFIAGERLLITAVRPNMKKIATSWQLALYRLRMRVEIHFRMLKVCYGLVTSLHRSVDGYLAHYLAAIAAHLIGQPLSIGFFGLFRS